MLDKVIEGFLTKQREIWLRKEINPKTSEKKLENLSKKVNEIFSTTTLTTAIKNIANNKNIDRFNFASHIPKFSNPSIKLNGFIANIKTHKDGFLRTGSVNRVVPDIFSHSGASDHTKEFIYVYEFLVSYMPDHKMIIEHLQQKDKTQVKGLFTHLNIKDDKFNEVCSQLLLMVNTTKPAKTSEAIKQVYFPVDDDYHLLSILYPSSIMSELRSRISNIKFNNEVKQAKEDKKNNKYNAQEISDIYNLTKIGFGGTKKNNISVLNNKNGGDFYLLPSTPPSLKNRNIQPPKNNFFTDCLYVKNFNNDFKRLHKLFSSNDTMRIKNSRAYHIKHIIYQVIQVIWQVRYLDANWSKSETYANLNTYQKIWLDYAHKDERSEIDFDLIKKDLSQWLVITYNQNIDEKITQLGDDHKPYLEKVIDELEEFLV